MGPAEQGLPGGGSHGREDTMFGARLAVAAKERTAHAVIYDPSYVAIDYPMGDIPADRGVCTDVVIRSLRALGIDLQRLVHEDMAAAFSAYPNDWGLTQPDTNIDHRRVANLQVFFTRLGAQQPMSLANGAYQPGDIVTWQLQTDDGVLDHIGIVMAMPGASGAPMVVHNMGEGPKMEDILFTWPMTGHFRLTPAMVAGGDSGGSDSGLSGAGVNGGEPVLGARH